MEQIKDEAPGNARLPKAVAWFTAEITKLEQAQAAEPGAEQPERAAR